MSTGRHEDESSTSSLTRAGTRAGTNGRARLHAGWRASAVIGVLTALLGFAIAAQLRTTSDTDSLAGARQEDLVRILDDQNARAARLRSQIADLQNTLRTLDEAGSNSQAAKQEAQRQADALGILVGTKPATGPGVQLTLDDPQGGLTAEDLLDVVQELRGAGAEAIQFGPVRVGTSSYFVDTDDGITLDGRQLRAPYVVLAIGPARTMDTALNIPGGVAATARTAGGSARISERSSLTITVLRDVTKNRYATPSGR